MTIDQIQAIVPTCARPLRVLTLDQLSDYHRVIYDQLGGLVLDSGLDNKICWAELDHQLDGIDVFHLHWPEWLLGADPELHQRFAAALRRASVSLVWSQHNLTPHHFNPAWADIYGLWARHADGVIHHSAWGMTRALSALPFRAECDHAVVHHPHFGPLVVPHGTRKQAAARLGWRSDILRLAIVGRPRPGKLVTAAIEAFARCPREDLELRVFSLDTGERPTADPRVHAERYARADRPLYDQRLTASDALIMPFHQTEMLTTGTIADAVAHGLACVVSDWPFLGETLGDAAVVYGARPELLTACLNRLDHRTLAAAKAATTALRDRYDPRASAQEVYGFLRRVRGRARRLTAKRIGQPCPRHHLSAPLGQEPHDLDLVRFAHADHRLRPHDPGHRPSPAQGRI